MVHWQKPGDEGRHFGLAAYADRFLLDCLDAIHLQTGQLRVFLTGHSLGGTFAALFSALYPERVKGLILIGAPVHFAQNVGAFGPIVSRAPGTQAVSAFLGNVPGSALSIISALCDPATFVWSRWIDFVSSAQDPEALRTHLLVERWTLDEMPLAKLLFEEITELLYREDRFMRGTLVLDGKRIRPESVQAPLLSVLNPHCRVVPPGAMLPLHRLAKSADKQILWYPGDTGVSIQHVGMLVGKRAHRFLWPRIIRWIYHHNDQDKWGQSRFFGG
jgi:Poly(3-hydroxyalkanoate) synthetase